MSFFQEAVDNLIDLLTDAIKESEELEGRLNQYDDMLEHISTEKMEGKTKSMSSVNENNKKLLVGMDNLVAKLPVLRPPDGSGRGRLWEYRHFGKDNRGSNGLAGKIEMCFQS